MRLSAIAHAWASGVEDHVAPICMPSAVTNFTEQSLAYLQGKRARIFIDNNKAGRQAAQRWATQLRSAGILTDGFSFAGLVRTDGQAVRDLNDCLAIDYDCWEQHRSQIDSLFAQL
jgi:hypothetical protein